jgi:hypothetical protein
MIGSNPDQDTYILRIFALLNPARNILERLFDWTMTASPQNLSQFLIYRNISAVKSDILSES